jgi:hypothetical protein
VTVCRSGSAIGKIHAGHEARRHFYLDLQLAGIGKKYQRLTGLHRVTDFNQLLADDTVERRDRAGIAQLGIDFIDAGARLYDCCPCLLYSGSLLV